jgi:Flp pilus assembly protein TadD
MAIIVDPEGLSALRVARGGVDVAGDVHDLLRDADRAKQRGNFEEAERLLQEALLIDPTRPSVWTMVGALEDQLGEVSVAREAYRAALSLADDDQTAMALARLHASVGEWDDAIAVATHIAMSARDEEVRGVATRLAHEAKARKGAS